MLLAAPSDKDYIFYGSSTELQDRLYQDLQFKRRILVLGEVPKEFQFQGIDYISNTKTIKRVTETYKYLGTVEPYNIIYDLALAWSWSDFLVHNSYLSRKLIIRVRRASKEELLIGMRSSGGINFRVKKEGSILFK